jgi:hypothetical protein
MENYSSGAHSMRVPNEETPLLIAESLHAPGIRNHANLAVRWFAVVSHVTKVTLMSCKSPVPDEAAYELGNES